MGKNEKEFVDTKCKKYIDTDVYTESKKRIKHIINTFDKVYVCFSGGKDSTTVLHLVEEVYEEMGIKEKISEARDRTHNLMNTSWVPFC